MKKTHGRALAALLMSGLILLAAIPPLPASAAAKLDVDLTNRRICRATALKWRSSGLRRRSPKPRESAC